MPIDSRENRVTSESYWNGVWSPLGGQEVELQSRDFYFGRNGMFRKLIQARLGNIDGARVLEFGGGGNNLRLLSMAKWMGANVTALDFSQEGLQIVRQLFRTNGCSGEFIEADLCEWTPTDKYDFVVHWGVLEHFVDPWPILQKTDDALKAGGGVLFSMPNMEAAAARLWEKWSPDNWSKHVFHSNELVEGTLKKLGFSDIECFYFGIPFFKTAEWERSGLSQRLVDFLQKIGSASARVLPVCHRMGHRLVSMERGFCARKPSGIC